jgi:hypothetical protein
MVFPIMPREKTGMHGLLRRLCAGTFREGSKWESVRLSPLFHSVFSSVAQEIGAQSLLPKNMLK